MNRLQITGRHRPRWAAKHAFARTRSVFCRSNFNCRKSCDSKKFKNFLERVSKGPGKVSGNSICPVNTQFSILTGLCPMTGRYLQPCMKVLKWTNGMKAFHYAISLMFKQAVRNEEQFVTNS